MTGVEFQSQMKRLQEQFGNASYSTERMKLIWREVQEYSQFWFQRMIDRFIGDFRQAPLLPDFREEIAKEREKSWALKKQSPNDGSPSGSCSLCFATGAMRAFHKKLGLGSYVFKCDCIFGNQDPRAFPKWMDANQDEYEVFQLTQL